MGENNHVADRIQSVASDRLSGTEYQMRRFTEWFPLPFVNTLPFLTHRQFPLYPLKRAHSRVLAILTCMVAGYNMVMVISSGQTSWEIALRSVLFGLHVIAALSTFFAIAFKIPLLMVPIILVSILTLLVNTVFCVLSITALADGDSFYGSYVRNHHASKGVSDSDSKSAAHSYAINTAITSGVLALLNLRSCFVHVTAYTLIKEGR